MLNTIFLKFGEVQCGVPKGSTLGPLLFLIYINDIVNYVNCPLLLFADDTVLYISAETQEESVRLLQDGINRLMLWTRASILTINAGKSKIMLINPKKKNRVTEAPELLMGDTRLESVNVYKYLGVLIDCELNFKDHIKQVIRNCAHKIYLLRRIRKTITQRAAVAILKTMIIPLMDYGDIFYNSGPKGLLDKLDALQRRASRIVIGVGRQDELEVDGIMKSLNIMLLGGNYICYNILDGLPGMAKTLTIDNCPLEHTLGKGEIKELKLQNGQCI